MSRGLAAVQELNIFYEKHGDGRYYIRSLDVPGLHLAGTDFADLQKDLTTAVKALLHYNLGFTVESIKFVPCPDDEGNSTYIARINVFE
jgi:hypothetical protein